MLRIAVAYTTTPVGGVVAVSDMNSTSPPPGGKSQKPNKPYAQFPLFADAADVWVKEIHGKMHYFEPWGEPDGALKKYVAEKDALHGARTSQDGR